MISDEESRAIFRDEALDLLAELDATLLELEENPGDLDLVNQVFRALHTIKGSGAMFGFDDIADFTHSLENVFDKVRNRELEVTKGLISTSFAARDHILGLLNGVDEAGNGSPERGALIQADVARLLSGETLDEDALPVVDQAPETDTASDAPADDQAAGPPPAENFYRIRIRAREPRVDKDLNLEALFTDLRALGRCDVRLDESRLPELPDLEVRTLYLGWVVDMATAAPQSAVQDLFFFTDIDLDVDIQTADAQGRFPEPEAEPAPPPRAMDPEEEAAALAAMADWLSADLGVAPAAATQPQPESQPAPAAPQPELKPASPLVQPVVAPLPEAPAAAAAKPAPAAPPSAPPVSSVPSVQSVPSASAKPAALPKAQEHVEPARDAQASRQQRDPGNSLRVAAEKLDTLVDLVGELVIVQAQISQLVSERGDPMLTNLAEQLERLSADLRDSTLGIRMLPIGSAFSKFRRLVRDLSGELGKHIDLVTRGEETELDKTVLERLADPLVHLLRNSIDHGIGSPEERAAAGKRPHGVILLEAEHSGSDVIIRITDDGRGMDPAVIKAKAVEKGLIAPDSDISDKEALKLIFQPGFSTAAQVTSISGRGVGMDVVHRAIDSLRGAIDIQSQLGQGTTITIRLPLTLAIIEGLQVQVGDGFYVIPLSLVEECVELHQDEEELGGRKRIVNLRGELVPYISLRHWFEIEGAAPDIEQIVVTGVEGHRIGIVVDRVIGEHQTVIKSLGRVYRDVEGISGATIKGDGSLALILDVPRLVRSVVAQQQV